MERNLVGIAPELHRLGDSWAGPRQRRNALGPPPTSPPPAPPRDRPHFAGNFAALPDPRVARTRRYPLRVLCSMALCVCLAGRRTLSRWPFGRATAPSGWRSPAPSHDTFGRLFLRLRPECSAECFLCWTQSLRVPTPPLPRTPGRRGPATRGGGGGLGRPCTAVRAVPDTPVPSGRSPHGRPNAGWSTSYLEEIPNL